MQNLDSSSQLSYSRADWQRGYESQKQEISTWIDAEHITGEIPVALQGTLFRNGPGLMDIKGELIHHPFDGDGMVCAFTFDQGRVHFQNRYVRTEGFLKEQAEGKICYRGFSTQKPGGWLANFFDINPKNASNTNVLFWGDRLFSMWEAGLPYRLRPDTLATIGIDDFDGALKPSNIFSAHPRIDLCCELDNGQPCLVNFGLEPGLISKIHLYEFNPQGKILRQYVHLIPELVVFLHDFLITPNYYVFFLNPLGFNPLPFLLGIKGAGSCIYSQKQKPSKVIIIPRDQSKKERIRTIPVRSGFAFHHVNAWENDNETLEFESICYNEFPKVESDDDFREIAYNNSDPAQLWNFKINLKTDNIEQSKCDHRAVEFPILNPRWVGRQHRYCYFAAADQVGINAPLQALIKFDNETNTQQFYSFAPRGFANEPAFVPWGQEEDEGWILMMVYDAARHGSDLAIFDAQDITQGPIATLHLDIHIPYGLHGNWTEQVFWPNQA